MICKRCNLNDVIYSKKQLCRSCYDKERGKARWQRIKNNPELKAEWNKRHRERNKIRRKTDPIMVENERKRCRKWYEKNKEYRSKYYKLYYKTKLNYHLERRRVYDIGINDVLKEKVFERARGVCENCGNGKYKLDIHHLDEKGKGSIIKNNNIDNLALLCIICHTQYHKGLIELSVRNKKYKKLIEPKLQ